MMRKRTPLAEIMPTLGDNGVREGFSTNETSERQIVIFVTGDLVFVRVLSVVVAFIHLPFELPTVFVITTIVQELATVSETTKTSLLVIFADVWLIIPSCRHPYVCRRTYRPVPGKWVKMRCERREAWVRAKVPPHVNNIY